MNYSKRLEVQCDDDYFMLSKIIISWESEDQLKESLLRTCRIKLDLQRGNEAVLRIEEVDELISKLQIVRDRLVP